MTQITGNTSKIKISRTEPNPKLPASSTARVISEVTENVETPWTSPSPPPPQATNTYGKFELLGCSVTYRHFKQFYGKFEISPIFDNVMKNIKFTFYHRFLVLLHLTPCVYGGFWNGFGRESRDCRQIKNRTVHIGSCYTSLCM